MSNSNVIEMRNITKIFNSFKANDNINLDLKKGEIHALLGENGAGKSTLMNILSGLLEPTSGQIFINGEPVTLDGPKSANDYGIGMVHQHFMLIDAFTVTENIILGSETTNGGRLDIATAEKEIKQLSDTYQLDIDPKAKVQDISVGMQQRVEILKTLYRGSEILIFDEPTAVLTPQEIDELMNILRSLAKEGKAIILITHKLDEIKAVADRCTIIRRGKSIETVPVADVTSQQLANMMVGEEVSFKQDKAPAHIGQTIISMKDLNVKENRGVLAVKDFSLDLKAGEIVGLAGIDGNGQSELVQALAGLRSVESGTITFNEQDVTNAKPRQLTEAGLAHIPEDRQKYGSILEMSVTENLSLPTYYRKPNSKGGILQKETMRQKAEEMIHNFDVRTTSVDNTMGSLSGGNQQKAIIARELDRDADFIIAAQPTRGLDVGAIANIHKRLIAERDKGKAVLLISFELDEILNLSDRIAVIHDGSVAGILTPEETNKEELGLLMAGSSRRKAAEESHMKGAERSE